MAEAKKNNPTLALIVVGVLVVLLLAAFVFGRRGTYTPPSGQMSMPTTGSPAASPNQAQPSTVPGNTTR